MTDHNTIESRVYIVELGEAVNRRPATIRQWERSGILPKELLPQRNERDWRFWTSAQVEGIKKWMRDQDLRPGKGLAHYQPTPDEVDAHIAGQRLPRKDREAKLAAAA